MDQFKKLVHGSVLPYDPDLVIISSWGNDWTAIGSDPTHDVEEFYSSTEELLEAVRRHTTADIALCTWNLHDAITYSEVRNTPFSQVLRVLADKYDAEFIDIARFLYEFAANATPPFDADTLAGAAEWSNRGYWPAANVHPDTTGQQLLCKAIVEHFRNVSDLDEAFDWNASDAHWWQREAIVQAEAALEYHDDRVTLDDETHWLIEDDGSAASMEVLSSAASAANAEWIEFVASGRHLELLFKQDAGGALGDITIDGQAPSALSRNTVWYPDADDNNAYMAGGGHAERDAKIKYASGRWRTSEVITITMTGAGGTLSTTFDIAGSVSGVLGNNLDNTNDIKIPGANGDALYLRSEDWAGRTTNIYAGDVFYLYVFNAQAIPLELMGDWYHYASPRILVDDTLDDTYTLRLAVTGPADGNGDFPFRVDRVARPDRANEAIGDNVITAIGAGTTAAAWTVAPLSLDATELTRVKALLADGNKFYYHVHRRFLDSITSDGAAAHKRVRIASDLTDAEHTIRIAKNGAGLLHIDALKAYSPAGKA